MNQQTIPELASQGFIQMQGQDCKIKKKKKENIIINENARTKRQTGILGTVC